MFTVPTIDWRYAVIGILALAEAVTFNAWLSARDQLSLQEQVTEAANDRADEVETEQKRITQETTDGWKAALDYVRAHPVRVLQRQGGSGGGVSSPTVGTDGTGQDPVPAPDRVASDCAETTLQLNWLQNWAERQVGVR